MKFGYAIVYVTDVESALSFYEQAFGLTRRFLADDGDYGELDTGATTLSFAAPHMAPSEISIASPEAPSLGIELAFTTEDVEGGYRAAIEIGATPVLAPESKPWGQIVSYVRDPNGVLVEICSPMG